jgi:streptogramin lyase
MRVATFGATHVNGPGIAEHSASELSAGGAPNPAVEITSSTQSLESPAGLAFDGSGDLWVSNSSPAQNTIVEFTPDQLVASGIPVPAVTLGSQNGSLEVPFGIVFDGRGDLWVANVSGTIVEFTPPKLAQSGSPAPAVTLVVPMGCGTGPQGIAFDAKGDLWIACNGPSQIIEYGVSQLALSGGPPPQATVMPNPNATFDPAGLAFDRSSNLWVTNFEAREVIKLTPSQLASSGNPTPAFTLMSVPEPVGIAIGPHPTGIPLQP